MIRDTNSQTGCINSLVQKLLLLTISSLFVAGKIFAQHNTHINITPAQTGFSTTIIQNAINNCAASGGGEVVFAKGTYHSGTIEMKSNVTLHLTKTVILKGSSKYPDYNHDAFIYGDGLTNIGLTGDGIIDGNDCINTTGEEGFRGPHCIKLINCTNITFQGITIINSGNWAINCRLCSHGIVSKVKIRGGHDGLHTRFCTDFKTTGCDFQTGDDSFAGNDNKDFVIANCQINTSCNAFRLGCLNLLIKKCRVWGPGKYEHKIEKAIRYPTVFTHFSPDDEATTIPSGNWLVQDLVVENADYFYMYNFENGLWQTGHPATTIRFERVKATGLLAAFHIIGDKARQFDLTIKDASFAYRENALQTDSVFEGVALKSSSFFYAERFDKINLTNVGFKKNTGDALLHCINGNEVVLKNLQLPLSNKNPYLLKDIEKILK